MLREQRARTAANVAHAFVKENYPWAHAMPHDNQLFVGITESHAKNLAAGLKRHVRDWEDNRIKRAEPLQEHERVHVSAQPLSKVGGLREILFHFFSPATE